MMIEPIYNSTSQIPPLKKPLHKGSPISISSISVDLQNNTNQIRV